MAIRRNQILKPGVSFNIESAPQQTEPLVDSHRVLLIGSQNELSGANFPNGDLNSLSSSFIPDVKTAAEMRIAFGKGTLIEAMVREFRKINKTTIIDVFVIKEEFPE